MRRGVILHVRIALVLIAVHAVAACGVRAPLERRLTAGTACREAVSLLADQASPTINWLAPPAVAERALLARWCDGVGPAVAGGSRPRRRGHTHFRPRQLEPPCRRR
jgi:hypothetical protein